MVFDYRLRGNKAVVACTVIVIARHQPLAGKAITLLLFSPSIVFLTANDATLPARLNRPPDSPT